MENNEPVDAKELKRAMKAQKYEDKAPERKTSSMHVVAFVLGILSIIFQLFWYIAFPCGIIAIVFGAKSARRTGSKLGKAGLILGIIGLAISVFLYSTFTLVTLVEYL